MIDMLEAGKSVFVPYSALVSLSAIFFALSAVVCALAAAWACPTPIILRTASSVCAALPILYGMFMEEGAWAVRTSPTTQGMWVQTVTHAGAKARAVLASPLSTRVPRAPRSVFLACTSNQ